MRADERQQQQQDLLRHISEPSFSWKHNKSNGHFDGGLTSFAVLWTLDIIQAASRHLDSGVVFPGDFHLWLKAAFHAFWPDPVSQTLVYLETKHQPLGPNVAPSIPCLVIFLLSLKPCCCSAPQGRTALKYFYAQPQEWKKSKLFEYIMWRILGVKEAIVIISVSMKPLCTFSLQIYSSYI